MNTDFPIWFNVLQHYDNNNYFHNGLTIPFLIGASTIVKPENTLTTVNQFVSEIQNNNLPFKISLMKCNGINQYIAGILDKESENLLKSYTKPIYKVFGNLIITDNSFKDANDIIDITNFFNNEYNAIIFNSKFSINNGIWSEYDELDKKRLSQLIPDSTKPNLL